MLLIWTEYSLINFYYSLIYHEIICIITPQVNSVQKATAIERETTVVIDVKYNDSVSIKT